MLSTIMQTIKSKLLTDKQHREPRTLPDEFLHRDINTREQAEGWITELFARGLAYHFEDDPIECLHGNGLVTHYDARMIGDRVDDCYLTWQDSGADMQTDCPIGHLLKIMGH